MPAEAKSTHHRVRCTQHSVIIATAALLLVLTSAPPMAKARLNYYAICVDRESDVGRFSSIAVDSTGVPHISYYDSTLRDLKYAVQVGEGQGNCGPGNSWRCEVVDSAGDVGRHTSIEMDHENMPHIVYYDEANGGLKYIRPPWQEWIGTTFANGSHNSFVLESMRYPRIAYYDYGEQDLEFTAQNAGEWFGQSIDAEGNVGEYPSLDFDPSGGAHIAYYDRTDRTLNYAYRADGAWTIEPITTQQLPQSSDIQPLDLIYSDSVYATPSVAYYTQDSLTYDTIWWGLRVTLGGGNCGPDNSWRCEQIISVPHSNMISLSLEYDVTRGIPYLAWYSSSDGDLKLAYKDGDVWTIDTVDAGLFDGDVGLWASLAIDSQGILHMSYYDKTYAHMKYARGTPVQAITTTAAPTTTSTLTPTPILPAVAVVAGLGLLVARGKITRRRTP